MCSATLSDHFPRVSRVGHCEVGTQPMMLRAVRYVSSNPSKPVFLGAAVLVLLFVHLFALVLTGSFLARMNMFAFLIWLLTPPLVQPACVALGFVLVVTKSCRYGRLFTSVTWVCLAHNAATSFILAFMLPSQAWKIAAVQFWLSCTLQVLEFVCAHMQISNIETVRDAALVDVPQAVSTVTPVTFHGLPAPHLLKSRSRRTQFLDSGGRGAGQLKPDCLRSSNFPPAGASPNSLQVDVAAPF